MSKLADFIANVPTSPFRDPQAGEVSYINPAVLRDFAVTVDNAVKAAASVRGWNYGFSNSTNTPPQSGQIRFSTVSQNAATVLWISNLTSDGIDISHMIPRYSVGSKLVITDKNEAAPWKEYVITAAPVDKSGYQEFQVALLSAGADLAAQAIIVTFVPPY